MGQAPPSIDKAVVDRQGLERAINWARLAGGALALALRPFSEGAPMLTFPFALGLVAYGAAMHVVLRIAPSRAWSVWVPRVNLLADTLAATGAMLLFAYEASWTTPTITGVLLIIVGAFRLGTAGALASAAASTVAFVVIGAYRQETFGHALTLGQAAGQIVNYLIAALLMIGILRELHALRSQRHTAEAKLQRLAFYDELTGLPNRALAELRLAAAIRPSDPVHRAALLLLGLDRFKEVNETFGRDLGDRLLKDLAARLRGVVRDGDTVARFGGDEFAIVMPSADRATAARVAELVLRDLERPFVLDDHQLEVDASIGIVVAPEHGDSVVALFGRADLAMSAAKAAAAGSAVYGAEHEERTRDGLTVMAELRRGIAAGELELDYQPQLDLRRQAIVGVEALVRWRHPVRGLLPPSEFMPLAEASALARPVTDWVLAAALRARRGTLAGLGLRLAVNLTGRDLRDPLLPGVVRGLLADPGLDPGSLVLEITERAIMSVPEQGVRVLDELRRCGVGLALDDFGTGYASLAYLQRLPVTELKLDRSFIADLVTNQRSAAIVRATVEVAHALGMDVVAEGVEDAATCELLTELGCDIAQGFYVARPMAAPELASWLARSPWKRGPADIVALYGTRRTQRGWKDGGSVRELSVTDPGAAQKREPA